MVYIFKFYFKLYKDNFNCFNNIIILTHLEIDEENILLN